MLRRLLVKISLGFVASTALALLLGCTTQATKAAEPPAKAAAPPAPKFKLPEPEPVKLPAVALGIDVLEERKFDAIAGKRIGLLTHPPGINRRGESTINVLRRAPGVKLVALYAPEHGFDGQIKASVNFGDSRHIPSGLPIFSLHGKTRKPTPPMLKDVDAMVIDLQDIGSRSYTFISAMLCTMAACFEQGIEVVVLDRPNPLGGLKVDGPPLDLELKSYVGAFRVPYVHGLTIGELARMAKESPGVMYIPNIINVSDAVRAKGKLTVVPMRGWTRSMRWPETGLRWIQTSPYVPTYEAVIGYAMVGLGTYPLTQWTHGIGRDYPFRGIAFPKKTPDEVIKAMEAYNIPGIRFLKQQGLNTDGKPVTGVYVEVVDWEKWRPTELAFYMQKQAALWNRLNPFVAMTSAEQRTFNIHLGSLAWYQAISREGGRIDVSLFVKNWQERAAVYQANSKRFWMYQ